VTTASLIRAASLAELHGDGPYALSMLFGILNDDVFEAFLNAATSSGRRGFEVHPERRLD